MAPLPNGLPTSSQQVPNGTASNNSNAQQDAAAETEFLVVGAGPAGAGLACFLTSYGECLMAI